MERGEHNMFLNELNCTFFNPNWNNPMDQEDPFESALSSMVSSPTGSNGKDGENVFPMELIGRLGSMCNSVENSHLSHNLNANNSRNTSCYNTPLSSPPKVNPNTGDLQNHGNSHFPQNLAPFSCLGQNSLRSRLDFDPDFDRKFNGISRSCTPENSEFGDSRENSSVSEQIPVGKIGLNAQNDGNSRKRKGVQRGKAKETPTNVTLENGNLSGKRSKSDDESGKEKDGAKTKGNANQNESKDNSKPLEPFKDYIHVRARRGQATDAHSLAERVRREKIGERMKFLQDLVPGCNKVTGKAVMLDEIINYVQSLQRQVEFLSMKLSTFNPRMDLNAEARMTKDMFHQIRGSLPYNMCPSDSNPMDSFSQFSSQVSTFSEDDLHNILQMGFGQNGTQIFTGFHHDFSNES